MKVVLIGSNFQTGGLTTAYRILAKTLVAEGYSVLAVSIDDERKELTNNLSKHLHTPFSSNGNKLKKLYSTINAIIQCKAFKPEVLVSVGLTNTANLISQHVGRKTYKICQEVIFDRDAKEKKFQKAIRVFDAIAPQSPAMVIEIRKKVGDPDLKINDLPCFSEAPYEDILASPSKSAPWRIGYFGRIAPHKGIHLLLKGLSALETENLQLDIWGEGNTVDLMQLSNQLQISHLVQFMGKYPKGLRGAETIAKYDALALTSTGNEGLPLVLLEAMAYGLPVLTTNVAAIPDFCNENPDAIMVSPDELGVKHGLQLLEEKLSLNEFSAKRHSALYKRKYSHSVMTEKWVNCLTNPERFFSND